MPARVAYAAADADVLPVDAHTTALAPRAAAAEIALASNVGLRLNVAPGPHAHAELFGEDQARYLVAVEDPSDVLSAAGAAGVPATVIAVAGGDALTCPGLFDLSLAELREAHEGWMPAYMGA